MTDVVLIHPNGSHGIYGPLGDTLISKEQPLWPRLIAGYLIDHGVSVKIIDAEVHDYSPKRVADLVAGYDPKIVALVVSGHQPSASTQAMPGARAIAEELTVSKFPGTLVMMGNHPSALPQQTLREERVDFVIDGEGPLTLMGLLNDDPVEKIPGLVWKRDLDRHGQTGPNADDVATANRAADLLDVDRDLHGRAWHLLPDPSHYRSHNWQRLGQPSKRSPYAAIFTSLGCPYSCNFCMINVAFHSHRYRMRNPQAVVNEMRMLYHDYGVRTFKIIDELFVLNKKHTRAICEELISRGLGPNISSWVYARPDYKFEDEELKMFRAAGFDWFALGIESGAASVRDGADKSMTQDEIKSAVRRIEKAGINVIANYIVGLPGETNESVAATLSLSQELNTTFSNWYVAQAYPGSKLYDDAIAKGWTPPQWAAFSQHNEFTTPLAMDTDLTPGEIVGLRDSAFQSYFTSSHYLNMITQKFGQVGRHYIEQMTSYKLKRQLLPETMK
jgi:radical SAM superfamily enzyme YgiQ (UPF0313 family)